MPHPTRALPHPQAAAAVPCPAVLEWQPSGSHLAGYSLGGLGGQAAASGLGQYRAAFANVAHFAVEANGTQAGGGVPLPAAALVPALVPALAPCTAPTTAIGPSATGCAWSHTLPLPPTLPLLAAPPTPAGLAGCLLPGSCWQHVAGQRGAGHGGGPGVCGRVNGRAGAQPDGLRQRQRLDQCWLVSECGWAQAAVSWSRMQSCWLGAIRARRWAGIGRGAAPFQHAAPFRVGALCAAVLQSARPQV